MKKVVFTFFSWAPRTIQLEIINNNVQKKGKKVIPPGIEPGTLSVLDSRDNRYTTESWMKCVGVIVVL